MIKSLIFHPEHLGATPLPPGRLPHHTSHRLAHAIKAGWQHDRFWLAEQYYKGKHAYASFMELDCKAAIRLPVASIRQDLIWFYLMKGEVAVHTQLTLKQGQYTPVCMGAGDHVFTFPSGYHRILILAAQFKWMKRYEETAFAAFGPLLRTGATGFLASPPQTLRTHHLRCLAHLRQLAHSSSFRQDVALYSQLADLFDCYLADIAPPPPVTSPTQQEAMEKTVAEISTYLQREVVVGNVPSLPDLADLFNLSETTLKTYFRTVANASVGRSIERLRMAEAKRLLLTTDMKVTQIAYQLGYNRLDTFDRAFKRFYRCPPHDMREKQ